MVLSRLSLGFVTLMGFGFALLVFFYAASPFTERGMIPVFHNATRDLTIFGLTGFGTIIACIGLLRHKRWAWWVTATFSAILLAAGIIFFWICAHPRDDFARSEGGFGFFLSLLISAPSLLCLILLSLPPVRRSFFYHPR